MAVTIKDVARLSGVSISTVSRVINNSKPVSADIKDMVLKVITETGYIPNPVARSLVTKKSNIIGVIIPDISSLYIADLLNGIEEIGRMYDFDIFLCNTYAEVEKELKYISLLKSKSVAGIILVCDSIEKQKVDLIESYEIPAVYISKNAKDFDVFSIGIDHFKASYDMTEYLIKKGNMKIAYLKEARKDNIQDSERYKGYSLALSDNNISLDMDYILRCDSTVDDGYKLIESLIEQGKIPDAIFAASDVIAIGALNALLDNNISVPEEVAVAGYDDTRIASMIRPSLTTIKQPVYDMGAVAARIIVKLVNDKIVQDKYVVLPHELVQRQST